jgi:hypothetical protein
LAQMVADLETGEGGDAAEPDREEHAVESEAPILRKNVLPVIGRFIAGEVEKLDAVADVEALPDVIRIKVFIGSRVTRTERCAERDGKCECEDQSLVRAAFEVLSRGSPR